MRKAANQQINKSTNLRPILGNKRCIYWAYFSLLLTVVVRVLWLWCFSTEPTDPVDAEGFHLIARNVLAGDGFAIGWESPFCPTAVRTPLYPLFLMISYLFFGVEPARVVLLQALLEALTTALVIRVGRELGGTKVGLVAGLVYALNGTTQRYTGYLFSEALLLPVLTTAVWLTLRALRYPSPGRMALSALFWGLALLTKPNVQFLVTAVGVLLMLRTVVSVSTFQHIRISAAHGPHPIPHIPKLISRFGVHISRITFWLVLAAVLFPWLLRNRIVMGRWMLSTAFEENLARVSAVAVLAEIEGIDADPWTETWEYLYGRLVSDAGARYAWYPQRAPLPCAEKQIRQRQVAQVARDLVRHHPLQWVATHLWGVELSLLNPGHHLWYRVLTGRDWETTGVVGNIWTRVAWSLERQAVGDALQAFWLERVVRIPFEAGMLWWMLVVSRVFVWLIGFRGLWQLRHNFWTMLLFAGVVAYILLLPGPIAYDRFYVPAVPVVAVLLGVGLRRSYSVSYSDVEEDSSPDCFAKSCS